MYVNFTAHRPVQYGISSAKQVEYLTKEDYELSEENQYFFNNDTNDINLEDAIKMIDDNKGSHANTQSKFYMMNISPSQKELDHVSKLTDEFLNERSFNTDVDRDVAKDLAMRGYIKEYVNQSMAVYAGNFDKDISINDLVYVAKIEKNRTFKSSDKDVKHNRNIDKLIKANPINKDEFEKQYKRNEKGTIIRQGLKKDGLNYHAHVIVSRYEKNNNPKNKRSLSPMSKGKKSIGLNNSKVGFDRDKFNISLQSHFDIMFNYDRPIYQKYEYIKAEHKSFEYNKEKHNQSNVLNNVQFRLKNELKNTLKQTGIIPQQEIPTSLLDLKNKVTNDVLKQLNLQNIKSYAKSPKQIVLEKAIKAVKIGAQGLDLGL